MYYQTRCSQDSSSISGNVGAYKASDGTKQDVPAGPVGILSSGRAGVPIADGYMNPKRPIWLLHGGDHFTLLFGTDETALEAETKATTTLYHWNGLPPAGPRMATITLGRGAKAAAPAPEKHEESYVKPWKGEIDSIVQADPEDKERRPNEWTTWRYEVALATGEENGGEGVVRADEPTLFAQGDAEPGKAWRCASCYHNRFKTMCFGMNDQGAEACQHCAKPRSQCGWTIWLHFSQLPHGWQANVTQHYGPKIVTLLATKWPGGDIQYEGDEVPSV